MPAGGIRAFLRRGKFAPEHSELDSFLSGRITREEGMLHVRRAVQPSVSNARKLRAQTLEGLHAWDVVYLDRLAAGRLLPGETTAAAEPLQNLSANEALLLQQAETHQANFRYLVRKLPPIIRRSLQSYVRKVDKVWKKDEQAYDRLFPPATPKTARKKARPAAKKRVAAKKKAATKKVTPKTSNRPAPAAKRARKTAARRRAG